MTLRSVLPLIRVLLLALPLAISTVAFQDRDHLTPQEIDLVKEAQELDKRIEVFIKAADRRLLALNGVDQASAKQLKKDAEKWGELPSGSRAELVADIARILDEAITNIDDVSAHDEKNPLIARALHKLAAEATRLVNQLKPISGQAKGDAEVVSFGRLLENAESILEAANKIPPPADKKKSKNSKSGN
jgi:acyl-CoA reductase-like NAD-dependent aldehyde dehydrogenase